MSQKITPSRAKAWAFDTRGFFYAARLLVLTTMLAASLVWAPVHVSALMEYAVGIPSDGAHTMNLDAQITKTRLERAERERVALLEKMAVLARSREPRSIGATSVGEVLESHERLIAADLQNMQLHLYERGERVKTVPIVSKGRRGSRWQTPTGLYSILSKEDEHFSSIGDVFMPYSMQFFGNFFIHGWPYYPSGEAVAQGFSGGCIRLATDDAREVYAFAHQGTSIFVYDEPETHTLDVELSDTTPEALTAHAYLLADVHSGRVYFEKNAGTKRPIASITKLMTALVANETIHFGKTLSISKSDGQTEGDFRELFPGAEMSVGEALYPLLMESNNAVAHALARHYGTAQFVRWMNDKAKAIGAATLSFGDASGISPRSAGTAEDIFRLARYLYNNQSFILTMSTTKERNAVLESGDVYTFENHNHFADDPRFVGGKTGFTTSAGETMVALFEVSIDDMGTTTVAAIVLGSTDREGDITKLIARFERAATGTIDPASTLQTGAAAASIRTPLRVISE